MLAEEGERDGLTLVVTVLAVHVPAVFDPVLHEQLHEVDVDGVQVCVADVVNDGDHVSVPVKVPDFEMLMLRVRETDTVPVVDGECD